MRALELIAELSSRGLDLSRNGSELVVRGPLERLGPDLVSLLREHKRAVLDQLETTATSGNLGAAPEEQGFPLTPMQQAYLLGRSEDFECGGVSSHIYHEIETTDIDVEKLTDALHRVVCKHAALRLQIRADGSQVVLEPDAVPRPLIKVYDLGDATEVEKTATLQALRTEMSHQVMPLEKPPFLDVRVIRQSTPTQLLLVSHDGLTLDGISMQIFFRDWADAYENPDRPLTPPAVSFRDYVLAARKTEQGSAFERARRYWLARIDRGLPTHPQLPLRRDPAKIVKPLMVRHEIELDQRQYETLVAQAGVLGLTPTSALLAAYCEVLAAWSGGPHFSLGVSFANRLPIHPEIGQVVGNFTGTLVLEVNGREHATLAERAAATQKQLRQDLDHRFFSGLEVLRELRRRSNTTPVRLPVTFNSGLDQAAANTAQSPIERFGNEVFGVGQTPQVWLNAFVLSRRGGVVVQLDAIEDLFPAGMIGDLAEAYAQLLHDLCADQTSWHRSSVALLPETQRRRRRAANSTACQFSAGSLHSGFLAATAAQATAVAIRTSGQSVTYADLLRTAGTVAEQLQHGDGGGDKQPVATIMRKGWEQIAAILGTVIAGAPYVPIDADLPADRIAALLDTCDVRRVLTTSDLAARSGHPASKRQQLSVDLLPDPAGSSVKPADINPTDLAYIIHTSGSTGTPKGVMVAHRSAVNLIEDINRRFGIGRGDAVFALSRASFDLSVYDIFGTLAAGATMVLPDWDKSADPAHWLALATEAGVTVWNSVPAAAQMLVEYCEASGQPLPPTLRLVLLSGDRIPPQLPHSLRRLSGNIAVHSLGGPTETTVWNITYPVTELADVSQPIPYGKPTSNNRYYILDDRLEECPDWVSGTLYAAGAGLAIGYWNDEARTDQAFFLHHGLRERLYCTGDIGRYLPDGNIEILGRHDSQVKINGYRVELGEIEVNLCDSPILSQCAVLAVATMDHKELLAYVVPSQEIDNLAEAEQQLRQHLATKLPQYMIPKRFVWQDALPTTRNGKVDRQRLAVPDLQPTRAAAVSAKPTDALAATAPAVELEQRLAALWCRILKRDSVQATQDFAQLGGDSIAAARVSLALRKEFGVSAPLSEIMQQTTVRALAAFVGLKQKK